MRYPFRRVLSDLRGHSGRQFVVLLTGHLDATLEGARLAQRAATGEMTATQAREAMTEIEHRGDALRRDLVVTLAATLITPIDREDVYRLSRSVDDVLDNLRDYLRESELYAAQESSVVSPVLDAVVSAIAELRRAVEVIVRRPGEITIRSLMAKKAGNEIGRRCQIQLAELFRGPLTMEVLKQYELLRRLDNVGLRLDEAANALSDAAVKRSDG